MGRKKPKQTIGERIRKERERAGLTQAQLAAMVGMTQPDISQLESGVRKNPTIETISRFAGLFKCNLLSDE